MREMTLPGFPKRDHIRLGLLHAARRRYSAAVRDGSPLRALHRFGPKPCPTLIGGHQAVYGARLIKPGRLFTAIKPIARTRARAGAVSFFKPAPSPQPLTLELCQRPLKGNVRRSNHAGRWRIHIKD